MQHFTDFSKVNFQSFYKILSFYTLTVPRLINYHVSPIVSAVSTLFGLKQTNKQITIVYGCVLLSLFYIILDYLKELTLKYAHNNTRKTLFSACKFFIRRIQFF